jgi:hypothetical protein
MLTLNFRVVCLISGSAPTVESKHQTEKAAWSAAHQYARQFAKANPGGASYLIRWDVQQRDGTTWKYLVD